MFLTYAPSGTIKPTGLLVLPVAAAAISTVLALPYVLGQWYGPVIYLSLAGPVLWGLLTTWALRLVIRAWNMRHPVLVGLLSLAGALVGYAASWFFWADLVLNLGEVTAMAFDRQTLNFTQTALNLWEVLDLATHPRRFWGVVALVYDEGLWVFWGVVWKGPLLGLTWLLEALIFLGLVVAGAVTQAGRPFSEATESWMRQERLPKRVKWPEAAPGSLENLRDGDLSRLLAAEAAPKAKAPYLTLALYHSAAPEEYAYLSVKYRPAEDTFKRLWVVDRLAVPPARAKALLERYGR